MTKYKTEDFLNKELLEKVNADIEKQLNEDLKNTEKIIPKEESKVSFFGLIMLGILFTIVFFKLAVLFLSYIKLIN